MALCDWYQLITMQTGHNQLYQRNHISKVEIFFKKEQESQLVESKINNCVVEQQQNQKLTQKEKDTWKMGSDNPSNTL